MDERRLRTVGLVARGLSIVIAGALAVAMGATGVGAHDDGTTGHLWLDHLKPMKVAGTLNDSTNPVDWTRLQGVPADIADGKDAGVESAGFGLKKLVSMFYVDTATIQRKLTRGCAAGQALRAIAQSGDPTCGTGAHGESLQIANTGPMCDNDCTEGFLVLTPGRWAITAQIVARQSDSGTDELFVECHLDAGSKSDFARFEFETSGAATLPMQLIATLSGNLHASVNCGDNDNGQAIGSDLSIIAVRLDDQ